jgi:hypothetical protein
LIFSYLLAIVRTIWRVYLAVKNNTNVQFNDGHDHTHSSSTCKHVYKKNKKHKLTCTLEIHYCKLWWWSIIETEKKTHTHTHEKSRSTDLTYDLFLVFPLSTTFSNKVLETSFLHPKILWFLIATIPRVSFSSSSYFPLSLSLTHNPIPLPRKNAWEKKFARCK